MEMEMKSTMDWLGYVDLEELSIVPCKQWLCFGDLFFLEKVRFFFLIFNDCFAMF
jgi:hypothetical protein